MADTVRRLWRVFSDGPEDVKGGHMSGRRTMLSVLFAAVMTISLTSVGAAKSPDAAKQCAKHGTDSKQCAHAIEQEAKYCAKHPEKCE